VSSGSESICDLPQIAAQRRTNISKVIAAEKAASLIKMAKMLANVVVAADGVNSLLAQRDTYFGK